MRLAGARAVLVLCGLERGCLRWAPCAAGAATTSSSSSSSAPSPPACRALPGGSRWRTERREQLPGGGGARGRRLGRERGRAGERASERASVRPPRRRKMGSRLLPLLALLGAAGLDSAEQEPASPAPGPSTTLMLQSLLPSGAWSPGANAGAAASPTVLPPGTLVASWGREASPGEMASGAPAGQQGHAPGAAGGRTPLPVQEARSPEYAEPRRASGARLPPRPARASIASDAHRLPASSPPKAPPTPLSGLASLSEESASPPGQRVSGGWQATSPPTASSWTEGEPGREAMAGAAAAAASERPPHVATAEDEEGPEGTSSRRALEGEASPPTPETPGVLVASTWRPVRGPAKPPSRWAGLTPPETVGQEEDDVVTTAMPWAQRLPQEQSTGRPWLAGTEALPQQAVGSQAWAEPERVAGLLLREATEPVAGPFPSGTALPPPPAASTGSNCPVAITEEGLTAGSFGGSPAATSEPRTTAALGPGSTRAPREAQPPADGASSSAAKRPSLGPETAGGAPASSSSSGAALRLAGSPPANAPSARSPAPGLRLRKLPVRPGWLPAGASSQGSQTLGTAQQQQQQPTVSRAPFQSPPGPLPPWGPVELWGSPTGEKQESGAAPEKPSQPPSPWSVTEGGPGLAHLPPWRAARVGPSPSAASPAESVWVPAESAPAHLPSKQAAGEGPPTDAPPGRAGQSAAGEGGLGSPAPPMAEPPVSRQSGRGLGSRQDPGPRESPAGSAAAGVTTEGAALNPARSEGPELLPTRTAPASSLASAGAAPPRATAAAAAVPGWLPVTQPVGAPTARTWERRWGRPPRLPTESPARGATPSPPSRGPLETTATSGPRGSSWHTWPPVPGPAAGSVGRGDPPVASTWLVAAVPEEAATQPGPKEGRPRAQQVFVVENQLPLLKAAFLHIPCELALALAFPRSFQDPRSPEYQGLVLGINETVAPLFASLPGFQRLEVKSIRPGSSVVVVVVGFDALFLAETAGSWLALNQSWLSERLPPGQRVANGRVLRSAVLERPLDLCALLFSCQAGYECVAGEGAPAVCTSLCHRDYCQNQGICTHRANHTPVCQCPVGSDFWFLGVRCGYKVTQQGLLGVACGLLLSLLGVGAAIASLVVRRVRMLLMEARADQTKSSYRRFCRLDDVSAHYWSEPWLAAASNLDNPAFSNSEELLHLQILDTACCSCQDCVATQSCCKQPQGGSPRPGVAGRPSLRSNWDMSSNSVNDPMIDSGKASEVSVSSWPMEPIQWSPFPALQTLSRQQAHKPQRPRSYCEGMELVNLERSWTA